MQEKTLADSIRSRLARGLTVRLAGADGEISIHVTQEDVLTSLIFAFGANAKDERPRMFEISERGRSHHVATVDDVLAYLDTKRTLELVL